jgi:hypothetical protein
MTPRGRTDPGFITVIEVNGLLDDILVDFIAASLDAAAETGAATSSSTSIRPGAVVSDEASSTWSVASATPTSGRHLDRTVRGRGARAAPPSSLA